MSNQGNAVTVSKAKISQFVHDAADMEKREYILREMAPRLIDEADTLKRRADRAIENTEKEINRLLDELREAEEDLVKENKKLTEEKTAFDSAKEKFNEAEEKHKRLFTKVETKNKLESGTLFDEYGNKIPEKPEKSDKYDKYKKKLGHYYEVYKKYGKDVKAKDFCDCTLWDFIKGMMVAPCIGGLFLLLPAFFIVGNNISEDVLVAMSLAISFIMWFIIFAMRIRNGKKRKIMYDFVYDYDDAYKQYEEELARPKKEREKAQLEYDEAKTYLEKCDLAIEKRNAAINGCIDCIEKLKSDILNAQNALRLKNSERTQAYSKAEWTIAQAKKTLDIAEAVKGKKLELYKIGIVPPDYRTLDATLMIANIFDNDLADTMREAVLLYDERVFRGEVLCGMHNIKKALDDNQKQFAKAMSVVFESLVEISEKISNAILEINGVGNQIHHMNYDMQEMGEKILDRQDAAERYQKYAMEEARAIRYATEELNESQEVLNRYIEDRRNGLI